VVVAGLCFCGQGNRDSCLIGMHKEDLACESFVMKWELIYDSRIHTLINPYFSCSHLVLKTEV